MENLDDFTGTPYNEMDAADPDWRERIARFLHVQLSPDEWNAEEVLTRLGQNPELSPLLDAHICRGQSSGILSPFSAWCSIILIRLILPLPLSFSCMVMKEA